MNTQSLHMVNKILSDRQTKKTFRVNLVDFIVHDVVQSFIWAYNRYTYKK